MSNLSNHAPLKRMHGLERFLNHMAMAQLLAMRFGLLSCAEFLPLLPVTIYRFPLGIGHKIVVISKL